LPKQQFYVSIAHKDNSKLSLLVQTTYLGFHWNSTVLIDFMTCPNNNSQEQLSVFIACYNKHSKFPVPFTLLAQEQFPIFIAHQNSNAQYLFIAQVAIISFHCSFEQRAPIYILKF